MSDFRATATAKHGLLKLKREESTLIKISLKTTLKLKKVHRFLKKLGLANNNRLGQGPKL